MSAYRKLALGAAFLALAACQPAKTVPDAVFFGGVIHTGVDGALAAEAVSIKDGRILEVGASDALTKTAGAATQLIDLAGVHLYPGFTDAHAHLLGIGERELTLNLDQVASVAELVSVVGTASVELVPGALVMGRGWIETHWPEARFPTRQDLDAVSGDHPVVLIRSDGHALVANTLALELSGIDDLNPAQIYGGRIELDPQGKPTGMLIDNAMNAMAPLLLPRVGDALDDAYVKGATVYASRGWTGVHNMSVSGSHVEAINRLSDAGRLPLRIYNAVDGADAGVFNPENPALFDPAVFNTSEKGLVVTQAIKLYMDGALGSRGALLAAPYSDRPETVGLQLSKEDETISLMTRALNGGLQISMHAIGDKANTLVLDWMGKAFATLSPDDLAKRDPRWRIEHSQIISAADIPRFAALGVIPSMQPSHAIGDLYFAPARLGPDRLVGAYAWRALIDAGSVIAGGSDAPVEQGDPRIEFYAAVARKDLKGASGADWHPEQAVTREEALKMFTLWPAYASKREADLGMIEPGKIADFTGFSGDLLTIPEAEILNVDPSITVIGGAIVWRMDDQG